MNTIRIFSREDIAKYIDKRAGETKYGEVVKIIKELNDLKTSPATFVLLGIPEDIGVRANKGIPGTSNAWQNCLKSLLNVQANAFTHPEEVILLGEIDCAKQMKAAEKLNKKDANYFLELGKLVTRIDQNVTAIVEVIVKSGKIPILIGGGHNNSYGNIKGTSRALQQSLNVINFDVHSDFRPLEHRHSGNGFSYAFEEGYLNKYYIFGLQKNYTSQAIFNQLIEKEDHIQFSLFENIIVRKIKPFTNALNDAETFISTQKFGLEVDLDAIQNTPSSALTPSGFSVNQARRFVTFFGRNNNVAYLHLCEGSPVSDTDGQLGKLIAFLITDFTGKHS
ncbi:MAG: arginase [Bacteroidetes bacterium HGW-Bacteroidetes-2]|jgi:formiminoglutamase|nr:MAG: arginase [Bacteroidetes bacterium HGW-Bacteroidetes-2]